MALGLEGAARLAKALSNPPLCILKVLKLRSLRVEMAMLVFKL